MSIAKRQALQNMLACILKCHFTYEEIVELRSNGVTWDSVIGSALYDDASRGNGQKLSLALKSRWPYDDSNDLLVAWWHEYTNTYLTRRALGLPGVDNILENLGDTLQKVAFTLTEGLDALGLVQNKRSGIGLDGKISGFNDDSDTETMMPVITLSNPMTASRWMQLFSSTGHAGWNNF
jgi:hypothetical protein